MVNKSLLTWLAALWFAAVFGTSAWATSPSAPINIEADQADIQQDFSTYTGNVRISQGGVLLVGNKLTVRKLGRNSFELTLTGTPATIDQSPRHNGDRPIHGRASSVVYLSSSGILNLRGNAMLNRGGDEITGDNIQYDWQARRTLVNNTPSSGKRVTITLQPGNMGAP